MKKIIALVGLTLLLAGTALAQETERRPAQERRQQELQAQQKRAQQEYQAQQKRAQEEYLAQQMPTPPAPPAAPAPPAPPAAPTPPDPFGGALFPPELIMRHQREIGLTDDQRDNIRGVIREIQPQFQDLQWEIQDATEVMRELLERPSVDEASALAQLNKILENERQVKRLQVTLMIRIKNTLDEKQQQMLHELRKIREVRVGRVKPRN